MPILIRRTDSGWKASNVVLEEKLKSSFPIGVKRLASAAGSIPPSAANSPRNLNNLGEMLALAQKYKNKFINGILDVNLNINKQNLAKVLKYLA
jgi:hypothetical protein